MKIDRAVVIFLALSLLASTLLAGSVPAAKPEEVGLSTERLKRVGEAVQRHIAAGNVSGVVTFWVEPQEQIVSIYMIQGGSGGALRQEFENAVRQAIVN